MKTVVILLITILMSPLHGISQTTEFYDFIAPFSEGYAAVKKGNQWSFINAEGSLTMNFRGDIVATATLDGEYPVFKEERCLIVREEKGISYFGFMDTSGKIVIEPKYLNANNFNYGSAIVIQLKREVIGYNNLLGKDMVNYKSIEMMIDKEGNVKHKLSEPEVVSLDKNFYKKPKITSKMISKSLIAVMNKEQKWSLKKI